MNEEDGLAAVELREKTVEGRIGDALSENHRAGRDTDHAEVIERAAGFLDRRLHVRQRSAGKGRKTLRKFAHDARVNIIAEPGRVHCVAFLREIGELAGDGENLHVHFGTVHVAKVVFEAAEIGGAQFHPAD